MILTGDCVEQMRSMDEASVDAIVCDPPYGLEFMGKEWDRLAGDWGETQDEAQRTDGWVSSDGVKRTKTRPFSQHTKTVRYHAGSKAQEWHQEWATEALRVLKPGGHLLAFGGTRTYHRLACAIEDAGFEIRDSLIWLYGSGFPKSLDVSKAMDKGRTGGVAFFTENVNLASRAAAQWEGWGTALKPGHEPIVCARKPLTGTVAANVLEHGTGALNIAGCRIESDGEHKRPFQPANDDRTVYDGGRLANGFEPTNADGRWPANVLLGEQAAAELDEQSGERPVSGTAKQGKPLRSGGTERAVAIGRFRGGVETAAPNDSGGASRFFKVTKEQEGERDAGIPSDGVLQELGQMGEGTDPSTELPHRSAESVGCQGDGSGTMEGRAASGDSRSELEQRFRYCAKASGGERNAGLDGFEEKVRPITEGHGMGPINTSKGGGGIRENKPTANVHPTVKPIDLMRWLVRLVTPPGGTVLDPFTGSGTTGIATVLEGFDFIGIERESEYVAIAEARIAFWAEYAGRDTAEVLGVAGASERIKKEHTDRGQMGLLP